MLRLLPACLLLLALLPAPARAQASGPTDASGLSVALSVQHVAYRVGPRQLGFDRGTGVAGRAVYPLSELLSVYGEASGARMTPAGETGDPYLLGHLDLGALFSFELEQRFSPFLSLGLSGVYLDAAPTSQTGGGISGGVGARYRLAPRLSARVGLSVTRGRLGEEPLAGLGRDFRSTRIGLGVAYSF